MAVLIESMDLPYSCGTCTFCFCGLKHDQYCMLQPSITMYESEYTHTRHPACPLREVRDENMGRA